MMNGQPARVLVFSGAGLSADSGISTFRGNDGLWENHDLDVVANGFTWRQNFDIVRKFYNERRAALGKVSPNPAHYMIAEWQKIYPITIITQNIDDLLERAGCKDVIHVHGKLTEMKCVACGHEWDIGYVAWEEGGRCSNTRCNSVKAVRPNVVFFHEPAPLYSRMFDEFESLTKNDCVFVVGTSGQVIDIDSLMQVTSSLKILNNLESSNYVNEKYYDHVILGRASENWSLINDIVTNHMNGVKQ